MAFFDVFLQTADAYPQKTALVQDEKSICYRELERNIRSASTFIKANSNPKGRVIVALERGINAAIVLLGANFAGRCYVPIDLKNPIDRLRFIEQDVSADLIIGEGSCPKWVSNSTKWFDFSCLTNDNLDNATPNLNQESLAAILYTSGSTGVPKGVAISHRAVYHFAHWARTTFDIHSDDVIASLAPFYFDLSIFDLFTSTMSGAQINFVPQGLTLFPARLSSWLAENHISAWYTVPSLLGFLALKGNLNQQPLPDLKKVLFAGEVFPTPRLKLLTGLLPEVNFYNLYGPTETNVCCYWPVDPCVLNSDQPIPIGQAACGAGLDIDTVTGELLVNSETLFSGYWRHGKLVLLKHEKGFYRTGDRVSLDGENVYHYHGRLDRMLKCSGFRVEPAEIERAIHAMKGVQECAVIGINDQVSGQRPAAAVVLAPGVDITQIRQRIQHQLTNYMQPAKWMQLQHLPYLTNGKVDFKALHEQFNQ